MNTKKYLLVLVGALVIGVLGNSAVNNQQAVVQGIETAETPAIPTAIEVITPTVTPTPTVYVTPTKVYFAPTNTPTPTVIKQTTSTTQDEGLSNNNYYTNSEGNTVHSPAYSNSVPDGASAQCSDGTYSFSQSRRGTCSHHGGVAVWY